MLETKILEFKIDIRALKRKSEPIRARLNRREVVILTEIVAIKKRCEKLKDNIDFNSYRAFHI